MKTSFSAMAAFVAVAAFTGPALAEGDYYEGASKSSVSTSIADRTDNIRTASIAHQNDHRGADIRSVFEASEGDAN